MAADFRTLVLRCEGRGVRIATATIAFAAIFTLGACGGSDRVGDAEQRALDRQKEEVCGAKIDTDECETLWYAWLSGTPVAGPKDAAIERTVTDIQRTEDEAVLVLVALTIMDNNKYDERKNVVAEQRTELVALCRERRARRRESQDLWPTPWKTLEGEVAGACSLVIRVVDSTESSWRAMEAIGPRQIMSLSAARDALPDYSDAQLRRAIAERQ